MEAEPVLGGILPNVTNLICAYDDEPRYLLIPLLQDSNTVNMPPFLTELKDVKTVGTKFMEDCNETNLLRPRGKAAHDATEGTLSADGPCLEAPRKKPLQLLDLPVDILREIVNQVRVPLIRSCIVQITDY